VLLLRFPPPLFRLKDLTHPFTIFKKFVEIEVIPVEAPYLFAGARLFTRALGGTSFTAGSVTDVFGKLAEFGEVEVKWFGMAHIIPDYAENSLTIFMDRGALEGMVTLAILPATR
jgi:hypothetical protein